MPNTASDKILEKYYSTVGKVPNFFTSRTNWRICVYVCKRTAWASKRKIPINHPTGPGQQISYITAR
ncbi:hypothetical protein T07_761 [Trichinella nelsoni]|uniref:Uncharacterized protein n=1 Tax=Trichinella nelsoni TaxID=6336 RepID=A0A0V0RRF7_9BILA|nr:hypothetical protein T07_761 [Trichinella nelsoni]